METYGGAERVTQEFARAFPEAPVHAILGRPWVAERMGVRERFFSLIAPRPRILRHHRLAAPVLPAIVDAARLPDADVLLTSSYAFAHRFRTVGDAVQVCYCHSPLRFAWSMTDHYRRELARTTTVGLAFGAFAGAMRWSDRRAAQRVGHYLTGSEHVADQIRRFYGREAEVLGAPVDRTLFTPAPGPQRDGDFFLFCGRLVEPYKRASAAIDAFHTLPERLIVAGDGPALSGLRATAPDNVEFVGAVDDAGLVELMRSCRAALFPSNDDLGLIPLEVMACGRPVLAYDGGGARHTVAPGISGELFDAQTPEVIARAVRAFDPSRYDPVRIREQTAPWGAEAFRARIVDTVRAAARG